MESALISVLNSLKTIKLWQFLVLLVVLFGAGGSTYQVYGRATSAPLVDLAENQQIIPVQYGDLINKVSTSGNLVYPDRETLNFGSQGTVDSIMVEEGERVTVGQALARIDAATAATVALAVAQAKIDVDAAQSALDELLAPNSLLLAQARETAAGDDGLANEARRLLADYPLEYVRDLAAAQEARASAVLDVTEARQDLADFGRDFEQEKAAAQLASANAQVALDQAQDALADFGPSTLDQFAQALQAQADSRVALEAAQESLSDLPSDHLQDLAQAREAEAQARLDLDAAQIALNEIDPDHDRASAAAQLAEADARDDLRVAEAALERYEDKNSGRLTVNRARRDELAIQVPEIQADLARLRADAANGVGGLGSLIKNLEQSEATLVPELADTLQALVAVEQLEADVQVALAALTSAVLEESRLAAGPDPLQLTDLEAEYELAGSTLDRAIQDLAKLQSGPDPLRREEAEASVEVAETTLAAAQQNLAELREGPDLLNQQQLQASVSKAQADLAVAEAALLDLTSDHGEAGVESNRNLVDGLAAALEKLRRSSSNSSDGSLDLQVAQAQSNLAVAQGNLVALEAGADPQDLAIRQAGVTLAEASLAQAEASLALLADGPDPLELALREQRLALAEATLAESQERLQDLLQGPNLDIGLARAQLESSLQSLEESLQRQEDTTLRSPFDGFVSAVNVEEGSQVNANATVVEIVDPSVVEVDGIVDEIDVLLVPLGTRAMVTLDALPDQRLEGIVHQIAPAAQNQQGVVTFPITVRLEVPPGVELREGLTTVADIVLKEELNVLLVPQQALYGDFNDPVVRLINSDGLVEERRVVLGDSDDFWVAVREGLQEGDRVAMESAEVTTTGSGFRSLRGAAGGGRRPSGGSRR